ncbi:phage portal protein [Micromonospora sp. NPDC048839]|uniref:phage portal protein n=1 Tax=Micromonospora sp. NPDC048839 TaxID=3155641 RepID=UPI0033FDDF11
MGLWAQVRELFRLPSLPPGYSQFAAETDPEPLDRVIVKMMGRGAVPKVDREAALSVPAVLRGRNLICSISTLPLVQYARDWRVEELLLLEQIDPDVPNVVTLSQTVEDLLFEAISWWLITASDDQGFPTAARHLDVNSVSLNPPGNRPPPAPLPSGEEPRGAVVYVAGEKVPASKIIRFDSPNPGLLKTAGRAIRRAILLDRAAELYADDPRPLDYFTPTEGADPVGDDEVEGILRKWIAARKERATGYVPAALKYNTVDVPTPADLQIVEQQKRAALDIANALGLDPEDLGISTTSRTYQNATDRRQDRINEVLSPYMSAITDRLSMGDVTKKGHLVRFQLNDYLRADPKTRAEVDEIRIRTGTKTADEVRHDERQPPLPTSAKPAPKETAGAVAAHGAPMTFADDQGAGMTFSIFDFAGDSEPARVDAGKRTITGLAVPYNKIARKYGLAFRFRPGCLQYSDVSRIKHLKDHYVPVGVHESVQETKRGPVVKLKVLDGPEGSPAKLERDQLLYDAEHGLYDGLSIGVDFSLDPNVGDVEWNEKDKVYDVLRASWRETSSTPMPAFDDARVTKVAASRGNGDRSMPCATCGQVHAEGVASCTAPTTAPATQPTAVEMNAAPATPVAPAPGGLTLSSDQLAVLLSRPDGLAGLAALLTPGAPAAPAAPAPEQRQTVDPTRAVSLTASVTEPAPYRFDSRGNIMRGSHDFSSDLILGLKGKDQAAYDRALSVVQERFDVSNVASFDTDRADTAGLNPTRQRPDMYVDQRQYRYPVWEAINKGTLTDVTPFVFPKFNTASGLVNNHTEGVEPTPGTLTITTQTVTPTAVSGKAEITREVWDQGGNPQVSGLIWRQMERGWYEALEARAVAVLDAATPTAIALTAGVKDDVLADELTAAMVLLQFVRGGFSMDNLFTQVDLYKALAAAEDTTGRPLFPALGPANASGTSRARWSALDINGIAALPAWALAASGAVVASSYLFDSESVHGWASAPNRLDFEYQVAHIDIAIWGYGATAISDLAGVREITYDPVA